MNLQLIKSESYEDWYAECLNTLIPECLGDLSRKYNLRYKPVSVTEIAMYNEHCCLILGLDIRDGVILMTDVNENGKRVEYSTNIFFRVSIDDSDKEGVDLNVYHFLEKVRRKHPACIRKSEDVKYPQYLTVNVWFDSHRFHGYKEITYIRKEDNKYKRYIKRSVGGWIGIILLYLFILVIIFGLPVAGLIIAPNHPDIKLLFGWSLMVFLMFLHSYLTGTDTIARMELNKYLKAQER